MRAARLYPTDQFVMRDAPSRVEIVQPLLRERQKLGFSFSFGSNRARCKP